MRRLVTRCALPADPRSYIGPHLRIKRQPEALGRLLGTKLLQASHDAIILDDALMGGPANDEQVHQRKSK
jgi:hypothetical protein